MSVASTTAPAAATVATARLAIAAVRRRGSVRNPARVLQDPYFV
jgi:hypothetical protein